MAVRESIARLGSMGSIPAEDEISEEELALYESLISGLNKPVTDDEARVLCAVFGVDSSYGLAWALLHLIESAPGWPLGDCLMGDGEWRTRLRERANRAGLLDG